MNYSYIETLVQKSKDGDRISKEELAEQFRPFILNLCRKTFIDGYEFHDIENECYRILFKCVNIYDVKRHRFVAYAINGIKNSLYCIVRKSVKYKNISGRSTEILSDDLTRLLYSDDMSTEDLLCIKSEIEPLRYALKQLTEKELHFVNNVFFMKTTLTSYSQDNNIPYSTVRSHKRFILDKLFMHINIYNNCVRKNILLDK